MATAKKRFSIIGRVVNRNLRGGIKGLRVEAWDKDLVAHDLVGGAVTDEEGAFRIKFDRSYFGELFFDRRPDLFFRVFRGEELIASTEDAVLRNVEPGETTVVIKVDTRVGADAGGDGQRSFVVKGWVRRADGSVLPGVVVRAFDKDLRSEQLLQEVRTDDEGRYEIRYSAGQFSRAEKGGADLRVVAYSSDGQEIASSPVLFNARPEENIDLVMGGEAYRGPSEFEQLVKELTPVLQGLSFSELAEDDEHRDVTFLSHETGQDAHRINFLIQAHRLSQKTGLAAEVFYGLFRQALPTELSALLAQSPDVQRRALIRAADENIIPARFGKEADAILETLKKLIAKLAVEQPAEDGQPSLAALLGTKLQEVKQQEAFLTAYINHTGAIEEFWQKLKDRPEFSDQVEGLQFTLQAGALTKNHLPLVQELQRMQQTGEITALSDLTRFDENDWQIIVARPSGNGIVGVPSDVSGEDDNEKVSNYARVITHMLEDAFPTAFITRRIEKDELHGKNDLVTFFNANPGFDLRATRLDTYLKAQPAALDNVADTVGTKSTIKSMQRLYKIAPRYSQTAALLKDGLDSAHAVTRLGQNVFIDRYGDTLGGAAQARDIHEKAQQVQAVALNLLADFGPTMGRTRTHAVPDEQVLEVEGVPEWATLFGSLEMCECEHCQSVHSPAAYMVDVLHFLKARPSKIGGRSAKDVLFNRRADMGEIELTCENTNTPLPYVDLVNEILEDAVASPSLFMPFELSAGTEDDLDKHKLSRSLKNDFASRGVMLSDYATINVRRKGERWTIDELAFTYTVHKQDGMLRVTARSRQTGGTAQERAANPQYINEDAYDKLKAQVFPWQLPFDLWLEQARIYLAHLGVQRYQLMEAFLPGDRRARLNGDSTLASEYLGLSFAEARIINGSTRSQPEAVSPGFWNLWGFEAAALDAQNSIPDPADSSRRIANGNWLDALRGRVDVFLQQSGLKYSELLDLLDISYINPVAGNTRAIQIISTDPDNPDTCETNKLRLDGLDEAAAARIVCFIRLWRKLGWDMRDLDRAIKAFHPAALNDPFLIQLSHVQRLHTDLNLPIVRLLSFWSLIDTDLYVNRSAPGQAHVPSLYEQLFRNRSVTNPLDPNFPEEASGLVETKKLSDQVATITSALGITAADFALLLNDSNVIPLIPDPSDPETNPDRRRRIPGDKLTLDYLSSLHRHATLAKALRLSVQDYLKALKLISANPFASTIETVMFVEQAGKVRASGFSMPELDYLLRHEFTQSSGIAPNEEAMAVVLAEIRNGLQKIAAENTFSENPDDPNGVTTDPKGDVTRQKLALLRWDSALVEQVAATLNGAVTYETRLDSLPDGLVLPNDTGTYEVALTALPAAFTFPAELRDVVTHEALFLFTADSHFTTELDAGRLSDELRREFTSHSVSLTATANVILQSRGESWRVLDAGRQYAIVKKGSLLTVYDESNKQLKASRVLTQPERILLQNATAASHDANLIAAVASLLQRQDELLGKVSYEREMHKLRCAGPMTEIRRAYLIAASGNLEYQAAIGKLFAAPRNFIARYMRTLAVRDFAVDLDELPRGSQFPKALKSKIYFDITSEPKRLHFIGVMTEQERDTLLALSTAPTDPHHAPYQNAIRALYAQPDSLTPDFLIASGTDNDDAAMFDMPTTTEMRFRLVLKKLLPYLRRTLSEQLVKQRLAQALEVDNSAAESLLTRWVASPADNLLARSLRRRALSEFLDAAFAESNPNIKLNRKSFPAQFKTFTLLRKIATIVTRFKLTVRQLAWLFEYGPDVGWLDLSTLPSEAQDAAASFEQWLRVMDLFALRDALPMGETALDEIFRLARTAGVSQDELLKQLNDHTQWSLSDLDFLLSAEGLNLAFPAAFHDERALVRLQACFALLRRLGMPAQRCRALAEGDVNLQEARELMLTVRAKYDEAAWLNMVKPLRDALREKQRAALVTHLVAHLKLPLTVWEWPHPVLALRAERPAVKELQQKLNAAGANPALRVDGLFNSVTQAAVLAFQRVQGLPASGSVEAATWTRLDAARHSLHDVNDLYAYFLIDVEMSPCMMTSRIKQALSSTQLFVQRCLMNLEPEVAASVVVDDKWREWKWMKSYRIWEANRKIFLYPENWIEPELRDDKSPFFKELESELLQSDLTLATAETAFLHYLEKLDRVARLETVGIYHQLEQDQTGKAAVDILHLFARSLDPPHFYYYRQRVDSAYWTPWERVDLDIEGDHLIPLIWNRRLYLFWPTFTEQARANSLTMPRIGASLPAPSTNWEIKLTWSERQQGKWANKQISSLPFTTLKTPRLTDDKNQFFFRSYIDEQNNLNVLVVHPLTILGIALFGGSVPAFQFNGCHADPVITNVESRVLEQVLEVVTGTNVYRMFLQEMNENRLYLPAPTDSEALARTPGTFKLLPYHDGVSISSHPFFYLDATRSFFVVPSEVTVSNLDWKDEMKIDPGFILNISGLYHQAMKPFPTDPIGPIVNPADPIMFAPSFPIRPEFNQATAAGVSGIERMVSSAGMEGLKLVADGAEALQSALSDGTRSRAMLLPASQAPSLTATSSAPVNKFIKTGGLANYRTEKVYHFQTFYHPYVCAFVRELNRDGVDGLLQRKVQTEPHLFLPRPPSGSTPQPLDFKETYRPDEVSHPIVVEPYPTEDVDFEYGGAYSLYNWELFFHAPLVIADRLSKNQRFEEAQKWFHYIFDPTDISSDPVPQRYWRTKKLYETTREDYQRQRIQQLLELLAVGGDPQRRATLSPRQLQELTTLEDSVREWRKQPFKPHLIARMRTTAYQKAVVMKYIDNLIAWGDQLFRRDTIESINEATQLYILAAEILGQRPESVPPRATPKVQTYNSLESRLDDFSNALVQIEGFVSPSVQSGVVNLGEQPPLTLPAMLYFCVPKNDKLLGYWDTVADRLFKIRHCMNIEGVVRQLPLFEPPIDPALLVRAASARVDISSVLNDINAALPYYRFNVLSQKASELCADLKSLGAALLSALEKRDAEELTRIRAGHETALLQRVEEVKQKQYDEAVQNLVALRKSRRMAEARYAHYQKLLGVVGSAIPAEGQIIADQPDSRLATTLDSSGVKMLQHEHQEMDSLSSAHNYQGWAEEFDRLANIAHLIPNAHIQPWGLGITFGGPAIGTALATFASHFRTHAGELTYQANLSSKIGQLALRQHDWALQNNLAAREIMQIDQQIIAAEIRKQIAGRELENHRRQLDDAREVEEFMRDKYTNQELYAWMVGQVAGIYFQTYQMAYDVAKRAERAYRYETGLQDSNLIQFGYWDNLKKGLLAGEKLYHDLKRMEIAYLDQNKREYEITKHISLSQLDPLALIQLRQTGECFISLPETLFDLDYPGHYLRRLKSIGITIPCVTGPYTSVNCTLTLLRSSIRHGNTLLGGDHPYARSLENDDPRFTDSIGAIQSIVTSSGQNDSGLFETNLRDERYLPFESAGVISQWHIELPRDFRQFDYDTISDVVLHLRYTAREASGLVKQQATIELKEFVRSEGQHGLALPFSLRHEFSNNWHQFLNPPADSTVDQAITIALTKDRFPFLFQNNGININTIELFVKVKPELADALNESTLKLSLEAGTDRSNNPLTLAGWNGLLRAAKATAGHPGEWTLTIWLVTGDGLHQRLDPNALLDILLVCHYTCS
jgi:receptor-binding and translocation channel-forming TcA subunit of Tc toxin/ABC toxin-like protein/neuraminidase-like protein/putative peptidoglycan binding protein/virulence plasmid A protein